MSAFPKTDDNPRITFIVDRTTISVLVSAPEQSFSKSTGVAPTFMSSTLKQNKLKLSIPLLASPFFEGVSLAKREKNTNAHAKQVKFTMTVN